MRVRGVRRHWARDDGRHALAVRVVRVYVARVRVQLCMHVARVHVSVWISGGNERHRRRCVCVVVLAL